MGMALGTPFPALGSGQVGLFHLPPTCPGVPATCGNPGALSPGGMSAKGPLWTLTHYRPAPEPVRRLGQWDGEAGGLPAAWSLLHVDVPILSDQAAGDGGRCPQVPGRTSQLWGLTPCPAG